jgi:tungstate transport system substrate-binding protein
MVKRTCIGVGALLFVCFAAVWSPAADKVLKMSTTTSTQSSGLLDMLLPEFKKDTGIDVKVVAKGTGAAIRDGQDGNVDIIFVHARGREEKFVADGFGTKRYAVMHNDFVILGPEGDPAKIKGMSDAGQALSKIAAAGATFVSRGDDSGTHTKEQSLWQQSGVKLDTQQQTIVANGKKKDISYILPSDSQDWYMSIGQGMGKTLTFTEEKQGYTMSDRGTFIKYKYGKKPALDLEILCEGGDALLNPYGIIPVNPAKHGHVANDLAMEFVEWIISARGQGLINDYRVEGKQLFFADAL